MVSSQCVRVAESPIILTSFTFSRVVWEGELCQLDQCCYLAALYLPACVVRSAPGQIYASPLPQRLLHIGYLFHGGK